MFDSAIKKENLNTIEVNPLENRQENLLVISSNHNRATPLQIFQVEWSSKSYATNVKKSIIIYPN